MKLSLSQGKLKFLAGWKILCRPAYAEPHSPHCFVFSLRVNTCLLWKCILLLLHSPSLEAIPQVTNNPLGLLLVQSSLHLLPGRKRPSTMARLFFHLLVPRMVTAAGICSVVYGIPSSLSRTILLLLCLGICCVHSVMA